MRFRALLFASLVAGALAFACGKDDAKPPLGATSNDPPAPGVGGSTSAGSTSDSGASTIDGGNCNSNIAIGAAAVPQQGVNDTLPPGTGGKIVNGVYDLAIDDKYLGLSGVAGPTGMSVTSTISITDTAFERVETQLSASSVTSGPSYVSGTFTVSGVNGVIALSCPLATSTSITYTAGTDGTSIILYDTIANEGRTYRLR